MSSNQSRCNVGTGTVSLRRRGGRVLAGLALAVAASASGGCDYLNLRNSFLNPSEVGRFDKESPFADARELKPVKWPILEQIGLEDATATRWANASDPVPADLVPEVKEYTLAPGDVVRVEIFELVAPGTPWVKETRINEVGVLGIQNVGNLKVSGLTPSQLEQKIAQELVERDILPREPGPQVSVLLLDSRAKLFSILGAVTRPGAYNVLSPDFKLLDALALAGDVPVQPGLDYLYVIRNVPFAEGGAQEILPLPQTPVAPQPGTNGRPSPVDVLEGIEGETTPTTVPGGQSRGRGLPVILAANVGTVAQADLDAALNVPGTRAPEAAPATAAAGAMPPATAPGSNYVWVDGKWVAVAATEGSATAPAGGVDVGAGVAGVPVPAAPAGEPLLQQRVIRIPINLLREGVSKYNIVVRPGDVINIPPVEPGEIYMMGNVQRPGVYSVTGRKLTLKQAVAAAGNLGPLAIPRKCEITRRIGEDQEQIVQVNLQAIFDGEQPNLFLKPNDVVNVGTDAFAPFLAVTRNAYRASYGFGFVYDRNYYLSPADRR